MLFETSHSRVAFTSDTNIDIPEKSLNLLQDLDLLLLDALVPSSITVHKHMNYLDACTLAGRLNPKDYRTVHQSHLLPWGLPHQGMDGEMFEFS
jgi:phosphoribosyl 1,2-cyclic phosphate phosphodiesterase